jgi:hypothetical protein
VVKLFTFRCRWFSIRVRVGLRSRVRLLDFGRYRIASREQTAELRESLAQRVAGALKS